MEHLINLKSINYKQNLCNLHKLSEYKTCEIFLTPGQRKIDKHQRFYEWVNKNSKFTTLFCTIVYPICITSYCTLYHSAMFWLGLVCLNMVLFCMCWNSLFAFEEICEVWEFPQTSTRLIRAPPPIWNRLPILLITSTFHSLVSFRCVIVPTQDTWRDARKRCKKRGTAETGFLLYLFTFWNIKYEELIINVYVRNTLIMNKT